MKDDTVDCTVITQSLGCLEQKACLATGKTKSCECDFGYGHGSKNSCQRCPAGTGTSLTDFTCKQCSEGQLSMYRAVCVTPQQCTNQNGIVNDAKKTCECPSSTFYDPTEGCIGITPDTTVNCSAITSMPQCVAQQTCKYENGKCGCSPMYPVTSSTTKGCSKCPHGQVYSSTNSSCHVQGVTDGWTVGPSQTLIFEYTQCEIIDGYLANDVKTQCLCKQGLQYMPYKEACIVPLNLQKGAGGAGVSFLAVLLALAVACVLGIVVASVRAARKQPRAWDEAALCPASAPRE